jgi:glycine/D-amino acid oxidase-like deaminating enzyme
LRAVQKAIGEPDAKGRRIGRIADALVLVAGSPHPKIDSDKADELWLLNTDEAKRSTLFDPGVLTSAVADPEEPAQTETDETKKRYHDSRAQREEVNLEQAQLDLDERKGRLIDIDDATQIGFTTLRALRDALRNTGARIAAQLAVETDSFACEQLVNAEIEAALSSVTVEKILSSAADDEDAAD